MTPERSYPLRDYAIGKYLQSLRRRAKLTQSEIASRIGIHHRSVQKWESGETHPTAENLQALIAILLAESVFTPGQEQGEAADIWQQVSQNAPHPLPPFDMAWFDRLPTAHPATPANASVFSPPPDQPFTDWPDLPSPPPAFLDSKEESSEVEPTVFIGREEELSRLDGILKKALAGWGQVAFVTGEAGQGKTILLNEFARRAQEAQPKLIVANGICDVYTGVGDPYLPFRDVMSMLTADIESRRAVGTITRDHALRLWHLLPYSVQALLDCGPGLIDTFLSGSALLSRAGAYASDGSDWLGRLQELIARQTTLRGGGQGRDQSHIFEEYKEVLQALASQQPLLLILDDFHWADLSSISLLSHLGRRIGDNPIFSVGAYRPEEVAQGRDGGQHPLRDILAEFKRRFGDIWVELDRSDPAKRRAFIDALLDSEPNRLSEDFRQELTRRSGGHPLFTVELLRDMQERGDLQHDENGRWVEGLNLAWNTLPARVEGVIEKRVGRLDNELRQILTLASVEGEEFTAEVLARVRGVDVRELVRHVSGELDKQHRLVKEQSIQRLGAHRLSCYRFRHNLFQKYLYHSLGTVERTYQHEAVGSVLETIYGEQTEQVAVQLARHFEQAGLTEKAVRYLLQASKRAVRLSANQEVIAHMTKGLALLESLPDTPEHAQTELELQIALGNALMATKGYAAAEVEQTYSRAWQLCRQMYAEDTAHIFPILYGLWTVYLVRGAHQTAYQMAEEFLQLAQRQNDPAIIVAHRCVGWSGVVMGKLVTARPHLEQVTALYNPKQHRPLNFQYAVEPGVPGLIGGALDLWLLGYVEQGQQWNDQAIILGREASHAFTLAYTLGFSSVFHEFCQEWAVAQEQAEEVIAIATKQGLALWLAWGTIIQGWALAEQGQGEAGIAQIRQGLAAMGAMGAELARTYFLTLLAEAYHSVGEPEAGLAALAEALAQVEKTEERFWEAEIYRLKGELLLKAEDVERSRCTTEGMQGVELPEGCFLEAIEIARRQEGKSLELRATVSLGRLWQQQGKKDQARPMLADIYGWFTEGFDTIDLQQAKTLLDELSA